MENMWEKLQTLRKEFEDLMRAQNSEENSSRRKQIIVEISTLKKLRAEEKGDGR